MLPEMIATWRSEITADLETARIDLAADLGAVEVAEAEVLAAKIQKRELSEAIARIGQHPTVASALMFRIREHESRLGQVDGKLVRARNDVKTAHARVRDLEDGLRQIEAMMPQAQIDSPISVLED